MSPFGLVEKGLDMSRSAKKLISFVFLLILVVIVSQDVMPEYHERHALVCRRHYSDITNKSKCGAQTLFFDFSNNTSPCHYTFLASENDAKAEYTVYTCANDGEEVEIKSGWYYKIDSAKEDGSKLHIHIYNGDKKYAQSDDGAPFDLENTLNGLPPKCVMKKVKEASGWDYKQLDSDFFDIDNITIKCSFEGTSYTFPDGKEVYILEENSKNPAITYQYLRAIYKTPPSNDESEDDFPIAVVYFL